MFVYSNLKIIKFLNCFLSWCKQRKIKQSTERIFPQKWSKKIFFHFIKIHFPDICLKNFELLWSENIENFSSMKTFDGKFSPSKISREKFLLGEN